jgi:regulator of replication initiation timing
VENNDPTWILVIGVVFGPLLTYIIAARRLSGKIKNTDATELWAESRSIREWSTERVEKLTEDIEELRHRMAELEHVNGQLADDNRRLTAENYHLRNLLDQERAFNDRLKWEAEHSLGRRGTDKHFLEEGEQDGHTRDPGE